MLFEQCSAAGCQSYLIACPESRAAALIDPNIALLDHYLEAAARDALHICYVIDTHTHADHFSASAQLARRLDAAIAMHRASRARFIDLYLEDGDALPLGSLTVQVMHTPGHTRDSVCLRVEDHLFTGDVLLIGGAGRTDLPGGDPEALYDSLFNRVLRLDPELKVHPAHDYNGRTSSTIGRELASNPRLQRDRQGFVEMMRALNLPTPIHMTEALRVNVSGGTSVAQMLDEAAARATFITSVELAAQLNEAARSGPKQQSVRVLDVREHDAFHARHLPHAEHLPRGLIELRANAALPDPAQDIVVYCESGELATLAASTLQDMGYQSVAVLRGGLRAWCAAGHAAVCACAGSEASPE